MVRFWLQILVPTDLTAAIWFATILLFAYEAHRRYSVPAHLALCPDDRVIRNRLKGVQRLGTDNEFENCRQFDARKPTRPLHDICAKFTKLTLRQVISSDG